MGSMTDELVVTLYEEAKARALLLEACEEEMLEWEAASLIERQEARLSRLRGALERIMHARGDPSSPVTNMGRAMMREIAGQALEDDQ